MSGTLTIYTEHFGLAERPFTLLPDPDFLYWSENHSRAYAMLEYGMLTHAPITGEHGLAGEVQRSRLLRELRPPIPLPLRGPGGGAGPVDRLLQRDEERVRRETGDRLDLGEEGLTDWVRRHFAGIDTSRVIPWAGLRPMMPDMMPRVKAGRRAGVFYNTGHGHLGWTLSAVTAHMLVATIQQAAGPLTEPVPA